MDGYKQFNPQNSHPEYLENDVKVIYTSTHQGLISKNGKNLLKYCKNNQYQYSQ